MSSLPITPHVHDCTGADATCPCGYVFRVPPVYVSIEVGDRSGVLVHEFFNCGDVDTAIGALRDAIGTLKDRE